MTVTGLSEHSEETVKNMGLVLDRRLEPKPEEQACHQLLKETNCTGNSCVEKMVFEKFM